MSIIGEVRVLKEVNDDYFHVRFLQRVQVPHVAQSDRSIARAPQTCMLTQLAAGEQEMSEIDRITFDPGPCGGRPCLRGLPIRVRDVLDLLAAGADRAEILDHYPMLEDADIIAALEHAARQGDHPVLRVV